MSIDQPAWAKLKTKNGKDRKRLPLACTNCRQRKIRCSGDQPVCNNCRDSGRPCTYRVTSHKDVFKHDPRAQQLAKELDESRKGLSYETSASRSSSLSSPISISTPTAKECVPVGLEDLPKDQQFHLFQVYFRHVHGHPCHLLHESGCMDRLRNNNLPKILILSVCANAARYSKKFVSSPDGGSRGKKWADTARHLCKEVQDEPNMTTIICLLLLSIYDLNDGHYDRSWSLSGQAIRMAYALGLHEDNGCDSSTQSSSASQNFQDFETRRQAMWSCTIVDRLISIFLQRPAFINTDTVVVPPPASQMLSEFDPSMSINVLQTNDEQGWNLFADLAVPKRRDDLGVTAIMIRSFDILQQVVTLSTTLGSRCDSTHIDKAMSRLNILAVDSDTLLGGLPKQLEWSKDNARKHLATTVSSHYLLLHLSTAMTSIFFCQACLTIASSRGTSATMEDIKPTVTAQALRAARLISRILAQDDLYKSSFAGYCAVLSMRIQSLYLPSPNACVQKEAEENCAAGQTYLHDLAQIWRPFQLILKHDHRQSSASGPRRLESYTTNRFAKTILNMELAGPGANYDWDALANLLQKEGRSLCSNQNILAELSTPVLYQTKAEVSINLAQEHTDLVLPIENAPLQALPQQEVVPQPMVNLEESCHLDVDNGGWYGMSGHVFNDAAYLSSWFLPYIDQGQSVPIQDGSAAIVEGGISGQPSASAVEDAANTKPFSAGDEWCI